MEGLRPFIQAREMLLEIIVNALRLSPVFVRLTEAATYRTPALFISCPIIKGNSVSGE